MKVVCGVHKADKGIMQVNGGKIFQASTAGTVEKKLLSFLGRQSA